MSEYYFCLSDLRSCLPNGLTLAFCRCCVNINVLSELLLFLHFNIALIKAAGDGEKTWLIN